MTVLATYTEDEINDLIAFMRDVRGNRGEDIAKISGERFSASDFSPNETVPINKEKLAQTIAEVGPLPEEGLFIGMADNGLPVLLNMEDPSMGSILFLAEKYSGKTLALKIIAGSIELTHRPEAVKFAILTNDSYKWRDFQNSPNLIGIFSFSQPATNTFINGLTNWAHVNGDKTQTVILLIDGIHNLDALDVDVQRNIQWLLNYGPEHRVWPIGSLRVENMFQSDWQDEFPVVISGYVGKQLQNSFSSEISMHPAANKGLFQLTDSLSYNVNQFGV